MIAALRELTRATVPARPLALTRIGVGFAALLKGIYLILEIPFLLAPGFLRLPVLVRGPVLEPSGATALLALWIAAAIALTLGWHARVAATVVALAAGILLLADQRFFSNHLYLVLLLCALLACSECGAALAVGRRGAGAAEVAAWPVFLLKVQLTFVYVFGALAKINPSFLRGEPIATDFRRSTLRTTFATAGGGVLIAIAAAVVLLEILLPLALWRRAPRQIAFFSGMVLHAGILVFFGPALDLLLFGAASLSLYLLFLDLPSGRIEVVVPARSRALGRWIARLDWLEVLRVTDGPAGQPIRVADGSRWLTGRDGLVRILGLLPATVWVAAPISLGLASTREGEGRG